MPYRMMARRFNIKDFSNNSDEVDQLIQTINEQSAEQRRILEVFNRAMNDFATQRSLETCLEALNASMQIANIRGKLVECYEYYARLLEKEVIRLSRIQDIRENQK
jgi:methyl-accepting chemotaxis protein